MPSRFQKAYKPHVVSLRLTDAQVRKLERLCTRTGLSRAEVMQALVIDIRLDQLPRTLRQAQRAQEEEQLQADSAGEDNL
jgi:hypothetical protein